MSIYQRNADQAPDDGYEPGRLEHLVIGNRGRLLDARRTPVTVIELHEPAGTFVVRIDDFEDRGATWEVPFEKVDRYQFERGGARVEPVELDRWRLIIDRLDRTMTIATDATTRRETDGRLGPLTDRAAEWLAGESHFVADGAALPDPQTRLGDERLQADLSRYMQTLGLDDLERRLARQYVSNPYSGDFVKGHMIVIAELGLATYDGPVPRDPAIFAGPHARDRRADHVLARLAFVRALFRRLGRNRVVLHRGLSTDGSLEPRSARTFVSASFSVEVARAHYDAMDGAATRLLLTQPVPAERIFMTYLETAAMNDPFREAEAVLLDNDPGAVF